MYNEKSVALQERTLRFAKKIIILCGSIRETTITRPLISQIIRSASSIGANYHEANNASSRKDFRNKICICKKESQETEYWLQLFEAVLPEKTHDLNTFFKECHEFTMIFQKIISTIDTKQPQVTDKSVKW